MWRSRRTSWAQLRSLLGPAFIASIAYVDPGNVAANMQAGAQYGYLLLWVLVLANLMAMLVQYLAAKLGTVTGRSLPQHLGDTLPGPVRVVYWLQAEAVAAATDLAEVVGGAVALQIIFGVPVFVGALVTATISTGLLMVQTRGQRRFELVIMALLALITGGFVAGLFVSPFNVSAAARGLVPRFAGEGSLVLATSMLGATIMPHAIYLHSQLSIDHAPGGRSAEHGGEAMVSARLRAARWDVLLALVLAGGVNLAMLLLAAGALPGHLDIDTLPGVHDAIEHRLGIGIASCFAMGLFVSGLASASVGSYAGDTVMKGLLHRRIPPLVRRIVTLAPALALIAFHVDPTWALVVSQVVLSFGIPFALVPLVRLTGNQQLMGMHANAPLLRVAATLTAVLITVLNLVLLALVLR